MYDSNQLDCIRNLNENLGIIACAGAGKTSTTVARLLEIIEKNEALPSQIAAITFTEKAAGEFKQRVFDKFEEKHKNLHGLSDVKVGTIHSFCLDLLKEFYARYRKFDIINEIQAKLLLKKEFNEYNQFIDISKRRMLSDIPFKTGSGNKISVSINQLKSGNWKDITAVLNAFNFIREENISSNLLNHGLRKAFELYTTTLNNAQHFDYSGIQSAFYKALNTDTNFQNFIKNQFKYIFIDEYQDVNTIQNMILHKLHEISPELNICVVGDDDQLIYNWRGSNVNNFLDFTNQFSNSVNKTLNINYRSSKGIVSTAESVVKLNNDRFNKTLESSEPFPYEQGDIIAKIDFDNVTSENEFIVSSIKKLIGSTLRSSDGRVKRIEYDDVAILVYSPGKLREFNVDLLNRLTDEGIPYVIEGTKKLLEQEEIHDILRAISYFLSKYCNVEINAYIEKYGTLDTAGDIFIHSKISDNVWTELKSFFESTYEEYFKKHYKLDKNGNQKEVYRSYDFTIQQFFQSILTIVGLFNLSKSEENDRILYNLASFSSIIDDFEKIYFRSSPQNRISEFLSFLHFDVNNAYPEGWLTPNFMQNKSIRIMSIHKAKGLEFPVVFTPYLCEQYLFPPAQGGGRSEWGILEAMNQISNLDELRSRYKEKNEALNRLFYVGITRSKKYLFMTKSKSYVKPNCKNPVGKIPTPFSTAAKSTYVNYDVNAFLSRELDYSISSTESEKMRLVFDFTTINDFFECPYKFKLNSVYGFKSPLNVRMGYGQSLHNILEDIHNTYFKDKRLINSDAEIEDLIKKHLHLPLGNHLPDLVSATEKSAFKVIKDYLNQNQSTFEHIELVEQRVDFKLNDLVFINGRVDLVKNNQSGEIIVVDFKSSNDALTLASKNAQLEIYALGYQEFTGKTPTAIHSYVLNGPNSAPTSINQSKLDGIKERIMELYSQISNDEYNKVYEQQHRCENCKNCNYKDSCKQK